MLVLLVSLRATYLYFGMITLAADLIVVEAGRAWDPVTGGVVGISGIVPAWGDVPLSNATFYYVVLALLAVVYVVQRNVVRSGHGRAAMAVRESADTACSMGIRPATTKLLVFGIAGGMGGLAGGLYALQLGFINPNVGLLDNGLIFFVGLFLGGIGTLVGLLLYHSLVRWVTRRPYVPKSGADAFSYAQTVSMVMWLWIFASAVEIVVVHLLIPWPTVRITLLVLGAWGLVWMIGFLASLKIYPHLLIDSALRVRHGATVDITIPWESIAAVNVHRRDLPSSIRTLQPRETDRGTNLQVGVSGQVNVHAVLGEPTTIPTPKGDYPITELSFFADDPRALAARARQSLTPEATTHPTRRSRK